MEEKINYDLAGTYVITHVSSGMCYVGSTARLAARIIEQRSSLKRGKNSNIPLQTLFNKDPEITIKVYVSTSLRSARLFEQTLINQLKHTDKLLNLNHYVDSPNSGKSPSEETRNKLRQASLGKKHSEETKQKLSKLGKKRWDESSFVGKTSSRIYIAKSRVSKGKPVLIKNIVYPNVSNAAKELKVSVAIVQSRISSKAEKYKDWTYA